MKDNKDVSDDAPPNSRLFIICAKDLTEENFKDAFEAHGTIEKIDIHKDKNGNSKGLAYIKFSKTSEAAHALEQLNGRCIGRNRDGNMIVTLFIREIKVLKISAIHSANYLLFNILFALQKLSFYFIIYVKIWVPNNLYNFAKQIFSEGIQISLCTLYYEFYQVKGWLKRMANFVKVCRW